MVALHIMLCFFVIVLFNSLSGFIQSTKFLSGYMKINAGISICFYIAVASALIYFKRSLEHRSGSTIFNGLCISAGIWTLIVVITTITGNFDLSVPVMNIVYSPLYAVISFDEWMAKIFNIDMGKSVTTTNAVVFIAYVFVYQLCYAIVPTIIIAALHTFTKQQKLTSVGRDR